jgi:hypothetical protein
MRHGALILLAAGAACTPPRHCKLGHDGSRVRLDGIYVAGYGKTEELGTLYRSLRFFADGVVTSAIHQPMEVSSARRMLRVSNARRRTRQPVSRGCYRVEENRIRFATQHPFAERRVLYEGVVAGNSSSTSTSSSPTRTTASAWCFAGCRRPRPSCRLERTTGGSFAPPVCPPR